MKKLRFGLLAVAFAMAATLGHSADKDLIGKKAPDFTLTDTNGTKQSLGDFKGKYVVLEWINHGCPFVKKHYSGGNMQGLQKEATGKGAVWLSIASSAKGKEGYLTAAEWNAKNTEVGANATAVLLDEKGNVGKSYGAKTTPHMFIINPEGNVIYAGAIDDNPSYDPADIPNSKNYVRAALDEALGGKPITLASTKAYGCSVKY